MITITLEEKQRMLTVINNLGKGTVAYIKQIISSETIIDNKGNIKKKYRHKYIPCMIAVGEWSVNHFKEVGYEIDKVKYGWFDEILPKRFLINLEEDVKKLLKGCSHD